MARAITGCEAVSIGSAAPVAACDAESDGCEWPWPAVTPGSSARWPPTPSQRPNSRRAASCRGPRYYRVRRLVSTGSAVPHAKLADAECDAVARRRDRVRRLVLIGSLAAPAAEPDSEACCELPWPALLPGARLVSTGSAAPAALQRPSLKGAASCCASGCDARFCRLGGR